MNYIHKVLSTIFDVKMHVVCYYYFLACLLSCNISLFAFSLSLKDSSGGGQEKRRNV